MDARREPSGDRPREVDAGASRTIVATLGARLKVLAAGAVMLAVCVALLATRGGAGAWVGTVVFGVLFAGILVGVVHPGRLVLTPDSFELVNQFGKHTTYQFARCSHFRTFRRSVSAKQAWVVFDYEGALAESRFQRANSTMTGANSFVRLDAYGLKADQAVELLNGYRHAALGNAGS